MDQHVLTISDEEDDYEDLESDKEEDIENEPKDTKTLKKTDDKIQAMMMEQAKKELPYTFKGMIHR